MGKWAGVGIRKEKRGGREINTKEKRGGGTNNTKDV